MHSHPEKRGCARPTQGSFRIHYPAKIAPVKVATMARSSRGPKACTPPPTPPSLSPCPDLAVYSSAQALVDQTEADTKHGGENEEDAAGRRKRRGQRNTVVRLVHLPLCRRGKAAAVGRAHPHPRPQGCSCRAGATEKPDPSWSQQQEPPTAKQPPMRFQSHFAENRYKTDIKVTQGVDRGTGWGVGGGGHRQYGAIQVNINHQILRKGL